MLRKLSNLMLVVVGVLFLSACSSGAKEKVVIYSSGLDYENEFYLERLKEEFPDYEIVLEYLNTGNHAAKLKAEGTNTEADITLDLEDLYLDIIEENLADLSEYDFTVFAEDLVDENYKYLPAMRNGGAIILNMDIIEEKGLTIPETYEDLLKEEYKDLISMPSPKSSGTGYVFVKSLVNAWGEEEAFEYFDQLENNILQFSSSGSGAVNSLIQGETAIALGITSQAVAAINDGINLKILFFEEGSPYNAYGHAMIKGKEERAAVKEVFDFFYTDLIEENHEKYYPELLYKDKNITIENYPKDIPYADMSGSTPEERERLLEKWPY